jgi:hypothetical protein
VQLWPLPQSPRGGICEVFERCRNMWLDPSHELLRGVRPIVPESVDQVVSMIRWHATTVSCG